MQKEKTLAMLHTRFRTDIDSPCYPDLVLYKVQFLHLNINKQKPCKFHVETARETGLEKIKVSVCLWSGLEFGWTSFAL